MDGEGEEEVASGKFTEAKSFRLNGRRCILGRSHSMRGLTRGGGSITAFLSQEDGATISLATGFEKR